MKYWTLVIAVVTSLSLNLYAKKNVGTITRTSGEVNILTKPKLKPKGSGPWVKFEERFYKVKKSKVGYRLRNSDVVQTYSNGKAMVVFANGDHINVGPGSSYELSWKGEDSPDKTVLKLLYGKVRGVVSPKGPRTKLRIVTKTAVAGVRGTDFHIKSNGVTTEVHVLRGKVDVAALKTPAKKIKVEAGFAGKIIAPQAEETKQALASQIKAPEAKTTLKRITRENLVEIQQISTLKAKPVEGGSLAEATKASKEIMALEEKAKSSVLEDIKTYNPKEYEKLSKRGKDIDIHEINTAVVSKIFKEAPSEAKDSKFTDSDFEDLDSDVYEQYFKD